MSKWIAIFVVALLWGLLMLVDAEGDQVWGLVGGAVLIGYVVRELRTKTK